MRKHWLDRPGASRRAWVAFAAVLVVTVAAQLVVTVDPHFEIERWFASPAVFGLAACAFLAAVAKLIGLFLKRRDDYYEDRDA